MGSDHSRPPSVDRLATSLAPSGLPHPLLVDVARQAIADDAVDEAEARAHALARTLLTPVINATGVLLHTNLGRAPVAHTQSARAQTVEFDLASGSRGSRQTSVGQLLARLVGAEKAIIVNNNAAAVMLVLAALADGRDVAVSRGESVEIGGSFRVPDVIAQSGCRLVDVGTTNRTRAADYQRALVQPGNDIAAILKVHPSNYRVEGFVEEADVADLATLDAPLVVDLGSGLLDGTTPWLSGPPPAWLADEPAAKQTLAAGADLVTFSGDKLLGGPQAGIIAGRADLVDRCAKHPLMRALRCGGMVMASLQATALAYLDRSAGSEIAFWRMAAADVTTLRARAERIVTGAAQAGQTAPGGDAVGLQVIDTEAMPGAGSAPGRTIPSVGIEVGAQIAAALRQHEPPVIAREQGAVTILDLRSVDPADDTTIGEALVGALDDVGREGYGR